MEELWDIIKSKSFNHGQEETEIHTKDIENIFNNIFENILKSREEPLYLYKKPTEPQKDRTEKEIP